MAPELVSRETVQYQEDFFGEIVHVGIETEEVNFRVDLNHALDRLGKIELDVAEELRGEKIAQRLLSKDNYGNYRDSLVLGTRGEVEVVIVVVQVAERRRDGTNQWAARGAVLTGPTLESRQPLLGFIVQETRESDFNREPTTNPKTAERIKQLASEIEAAFETEA